MKLKKIFLLSVLVCLPRCAHADIIKYVQLSSSSATNTIQPGTTNYRIYIPSGTVNWLNTSTFTVVNSTSTGDQVQLRSTTTFNASFFRGTRTDSSTVTLQGASFNGTKTDNSTTTATANWALNGSSNSIRGTITNNGACQGCVGEYISTYNSLTGNLTSGQWLDVSTITLTAGDWIVSGLVSIAPQTANPVFTRVQIGISSTAGNSSAGLNDGENECDGFLPTSANNRGGVSIPQYRVSLTATTPYYLKVNAAWITDTVKALGRISATRTR